eukprot:scaffold7116_cov296-Pinguiococcus_pyrenoidosus.AAC.9
MGNKTDLAHKRQIPTEEANKFAEDNGIMAFMEGSATAYHEVSRRRSGRRLRRSFTTALRRNFTNAFPKVEEAFVTTANAIYEVNGANEANLKDGASASALLNSRKGSQRAGCC